MIILDYRDKRPIYEQVVEKLAYLIVCGVLEADSKMPSVRSLAMELSINPNTIQRAYQELEQAGYLYTVKGRGNFVSSDKEWRGEIQKQIIEQGKALTLQAKQAGISKDNWIELLRNHYDKEGSND